MVSKWNKNDNECLQWSAISALNYNEIVKSLKTYLKKIKHEGKDFSSQKRDCKNYEQSNESIVLNVLFLSQNSEEITLLYKSELKYNGESNALLFMVNDDDDDDDDDDDEKYYYFAAKRKLELHSSEWWRNKKE